jgi:hypothetical protein
MLLVDKSTVYKKGSGSPNANQIAERVVELIEQLPGRDGAGKSSIRDSIKEGIILLNKVT